MKKILFFLLALVISCTAAKVKKQIIIQVNQSEMTVKEFAQRLTEKLQGSDIIIAKTTDTLKNIKDLIVLDFINQVIIQDWAQANSIKIEAADLAKEIQSFRSQYPDDVSFRSALSEDNLTYERWKKNVEDSLLARRVHEDVTKNVEGPTDKEISDYYQANRSRFHQKRTSRIRQIVLAKSMDAEKLYAQIKRDTDFAKLAKDFSIGSEADSGGDIGWIEEGIAEVFDEAAKLPVKTISKPLKSPFGFHIIQVLEKRPARQRPLQEVRGLIQQELFEDRKQKAYSAWFEERRASARVLINEEVLETMSIELRDD